MLLAIIKNFICDLLNSLNFIRSIKWFSPSFSAFVCKQADMFYFNVLTNRLPNNRQITVVFQFFHVSLVVPLNSVKSIIESSRRDTYRCFKYKLSLENISMYIFFCTNSFVYFRWSDHKLTIKRVYLNMLIKTIECFNLKLVSFYKNTFGIIYNLIKEDLKQIQTSVSTNNIRNVYDNNQFSMKNNSFVSSCYGT